MKQIIKTFGLAFTCLALFLSMIQSQAASGITTNGTTITLPPLPTLPTTAGTTATNLGQLLGLPTGITSGLDSFAQGLVDAYPYVSNGIISLDSGVLYDKSLSKNKLGAYVAAVMPMTAQSAIGIGGFAEGGQFGTATVNLTIGTTVSNVFLLGNVYTFASSGPNYDFSRNPATKSAYGIGAYNAAGFFKNWDLNGVQKGTTPKWYQNIDIGVKVGFYNISQLPGVGEFAGISATKCWK